jgi:hypothetical protein
MMTTWYVSSDWHLTVFIAPMLVYFLWKHEDAAKITIKSLIICSSVLVGIWAFMNEFVIGDYVM